MPLFLNTIIECISFRKNIPVAVLELVDCQGHLEDDGGNHGSSICNRLLDPIKTLIFISQSQMLPCFMELQT